MPVFRMGADVGFSIQIQGMDWLKPTVHCEVDFEEMPTPEQVKEKWDWLWEHGITPASDQLFGLLMSELQRRLGAEAQRTTAADRFVPPAPEPGAAYG